MASHSLPPSAIDLHRLEKIPVGPLKVVVFRNVFVPEKDLPDPFYTPGLSGRFGTAAGTVYATDSATVSWAEYLRNVKFEVIEEAGWDEYPTGLTVHELNPIAQHDVPKLIPTRAIMKLVVDLPRVADLTEPMAIYQLHHAGFDAGHLTADGYGDCQALAAAAESLNWNALKVPSAAWRNTPGWCLPIFKATTDVSKIKVEPVAMNTRATLAIAHATTYKAGHRPTWLPPVPSPV